MLAYNPVESVWYCDLQCFFCDGYDKRPCLLGGGLPMRSVMSSCIARRKLLWEFKPEGVWVGAHTLDVTKQAPPVYPDEMLH